MRSCPGFLLQALQRSLPGFRSPGGMRPAACNFVTGSDVSGGLPPDLNWGALADAQATTAVFMGKRTFPQLAKGLVDHGLTENTPAVLAESLGRSSQRIVRAPLAELAEKLAKDPVRAPAIIIYGPLSGS